MIRLTLVWCASLLMTMQVTAVEYETVTDQEIGTIERLDPRLEALVPPDAKIEVLGAGFAWTEGPVWVPRDGGFLLFSDIPRNSIVKWSEADGISLFMKPSGFTGVADYGREPGSNGLMLDGDGNLVCCEHGDRRVSVMPWDGGKLTIVDRFEGKRLNSPNDLVFHSNGDLYFTDPPYGLPQRENDPRRELDFFGVYRVTSEGEVTVITKEMSRPNGIAFSPDERTLYVAQSDPRKAVILAIDVGDEGRTSEPRLFYDATPDVGQRRGLPDGMAVDKHGNLFATGPGGVLVISPEGELLGRIDTGEPTANCCFGGDDGSTLYITANKVLCRVKTNTVGLGW